MADNTNDSSSDFLEHQTAYLGFLKMTKWTIGIVVVLLIALFFIVQP